MAGLELYPARWSDPPFSLLRLSFPASPASIPVNSWAGTMHPDETTLPFVYLKSPDPQTIASVRQEELQLQQQEHREQPPPQQTAMGEGRVITRMRPSLTCIPCKRKKIKCDKQKPVCSQCGRTNATCHYESVSAPSSDTGGGRSWDRHRQGHPIKRHRNLQVNNTTAMQLEGVSSARQQEIENDLQRDSGVSLQGTSSLYPLTVPGRAFSTQEMDLDMMQWQSEAGSEGHRENGTDGGLDGVHSNHLFGEMDAEISSFLDGRCPLFSAADLKDMENFCHSLPPQAASDFLRDSAAGAVGSVPTPPATSGSSGRSSSAGMYDTSRFASTRAALTEFAAPAERPGPTYQNNESKEAIAGPAPSCRSLSLHPSPQEQQNHPERPRQQRTSSTASMETLDFDEKTARPRRYIPRDNEKQAAAPAGSLHVNTTPGNHVRFLGSPFWAWSSSSQKSLGNMLLTSHLSQHVSNQMHQSHQAELSRMMQSLPPKKMCDVLLDSFLLGVQPLLPMAHVPTLRSRYDAFWAQFSRNRNTRSGSTPPAPDIMPALKQDPSFAPLLWSVLYCGAVAAPPNLLTRASFRVSDKWTFLSRLRAYLNQALQLCGHAKFPTLDGLVASILAQWCDPGVDQIIDMPPFIAQCVQGARVLGIHKETALAQLSETDAETGRMVWQHIMELEVLATVCSGTCLAFLSSEDSFDMPPPLKMSDLAPGSTLSSSSSKVLARGRLEMIRIMRRVIKVCYFNSGYGSSTGDNKTTATPTRDDIKALSLEVEAFENIMDGLVGLLNVRGQPEHGQISSLLLGANPLIHGELYTDSTRDSTVPNAFYRIILMMMKYFVSVLFNRQFLQHREPSHSEGKHMDEDAEVNNRLIWNLQLSNCVQLIRNYLDLCRLPAFVPYRWLCPGKVDCFQECMIVLTFLKEYPDASSERQLLQYLLSEVFDVFDSRVRMPGMGAGTGSSTDDEYDLEQRKRQSGKTASWLVLRQLYDEVFFESQHGTEEAGEWDDDVDSDDDAAMEEEDESTVDLRQQRSSCPLPSTPMNSVIHSPQPRYQHNLTQTFDVMDQAPPQQARRSRASTSTSASGLSISERDRRVQAGYLDFPQPQRGMLSQENHSTLQQFGRHNQDARHHEQDRSYSASRRQYSTAPAQIKEGHHEYIENAYPIVPGGWIKQHPTRLSSPTHADMAARATGLGIQPITASNSSASLRSAGIQRSSMRVPGASASSTWSAVRAAIPMTSEAEEMPEEWLDILR